MMSTTINFSAILQMFAFLHSPHHLHFLRLLHNSQILLGLLYSIHPHRNLIDIIAHQLQLRWKVFSFVIAIDYFVMALLALKPLSAPSMDLTYCLSGHL